METDQPMPPDQPSEKESALARLNKKLWTALAGLSLLYVAGTAAVVGDKTDFLGLGNPPTQASVASGVDPKASAYKPIQPEDLTSDEDDEWDPGCAEQIRADAGMGQAGRIEPIGRGRAPFPTAQTEYYLAYAPAGTLRYVCVIVLPRKITIARAEPFPAPRTVSPPEVGKGAEKR